MDRVLVMDRNNVSGNSRKSSKNGYQVNNTFCNLQNKEDLVIISRNTYISWYGINPYIFWFQDCYYEPFSKCSFDDAIDMETYIRTILPRNPDPSPRIRQDALANFHSSSIGWENYRQDKVVYLDPSPLGDRIIPIRFNTFLDCRYFQS